MATVWYVKKKLSLVNKAAKENILAKEGTEYHFRLGKNLTSFTDFIVYRMYHWDKFDRVLVIGMTGNTASGIEVPENKDDDSLDPSPLFWDELVVPTDSTDGAAVVTDGVSTLVRTTDDDVEESKVIFYKEPLDG